MTVPNEAVEAAAMAIYQSHGMNVWGKEDDLGRAYYMRQAELALTAAAPFIAAQAWDEGSEAGYLDEGRNNPYRRET